MHLMNMKTIFNLSKDFVLVWEESVNPSKLAESDKLSPGSSRDTHRKWRTEFLSRLQDAGIHQETVSNYDNIFMHIKFSLRSIFGLLPCSVCALYLCKKVLGNMV